uniref:Uncharacterized protein n=1 Tax=Parascaris equorum TaxID=6256 RepID=A0A914RSV1_PAREQ
MALTSHAQSLLCGRVLKGVLQFVRFPRNCVRSFVTYAEVLLCGTRSSHSRTSNEKRKKQKIREGGTRAQLKLSLTALTAALDCFNDDLVSCDCCSSLLTHTTLPCNCAQILFAIL